MNFLIYGIHFDSNSGGLIALHRLAHELCLLGQKVYIHASSKNNDWHGELLGDRQLDMSKTVVLYPEIVCGNPLNAAHVARWLLNGVGVLGGDANSWGVRDLVFKYCDYFTAPRNIDGELRVLNAEVDFWSEPGDLTNRSGECYTVRKGGAKVRDKHSTDSYSIEHIMDKHSLRNVFRSKEKFVSYDHATFLSVQAAMAGCLSIVIPDGVNSAEIWRSKFPQHRYGLAYGFDESEIEHAHSTQHLVKEHIRKLEQDSIATIENFIKVCRKRVHT
jgi:hypothetical protein